MTDNVGKLEAVFSDHNINFKSTDSVFNVITKKGVGSKLGKSFLDCEAIGEALYSNFVDERLFGEVSVWEPLKKRKIPIFKVHVKSCNIKTKEGVVNIKEERKLMSCFIVASRTRQDIDLPYYFGEYEFSVVPRSLFNRYGVLIPSKDKSSVFHLIKDLSPASVITDSGELARGDNKVKVLDAMAIVNSIQIEKNNDIELCKDFAAEFINRVQLKSFIFKETRVIFDRYDELSLKSKTRENRAGGTQTQYKVEDDTFISNLKTKEFLSSAKTKEELTIYLSEKLVREFLHQNKQSVVVYNNKCETNISNFDNNLRVYCHEDADTLIVLHGIDVAKRDPFQELYIDCCDTDVFLLLLYYSVFITVFNGKNDCVDIGLLYEVLDKEKVRALPGFHAFTGCDQNGKFRGFSKETCWKTFIDSPEVVVKSFQELGSSNEHPSEEVIHGLLLFVLNLYCNKRPNEYTWIAAMVHVLKVSI